MQQLQKSENSMTRPCHSGTAEHIKIKEYAIIVEAN
jgi:hypothetical protein